MAGRTNREVRDQDVQGLKCLRKLRPLVSMLRTVGQRITALHGTAIDTVTRVVELS